MARTRIRGLHEEPGMGQSALLVHPETFRHVTILVRSSYDSRHGGERFDHWQVSATNGCEQSQQKRILEDRSSPAGGCNCDPEMRRALFGHLGQ